MQKIRPQKRRVAVIMSTYNPRLDHLRVQMDSVLSQTVRPSVYVRDDGSDDGPAIDYLKNLASEGTIAFEQGENLGFTRSFLSALAMAEDEEYFAFCDQDDKWLPRKLEYAIETLDGRGAQTPGSAPFLYFSHYVFCDGELNPISDQAPHPKGISFRNALTESIALGMVMVFNRSLKDYALNGDAVKIVGHDSWLYLLATGLGAVVEDERITNQYRRHGTTTSDAGISNVRKTILRIRRFIFEDELSALQTMYLEFNRMYCNSLSDQNRRLLTLFLPGKRLRKTVIKFFYPKPFRQNLFDELGCRALFLLGRL